MIRTNFEKESLLVGENFGKLIEKFGGKGAGLILMDRISREHPWIENLGGRVPKYHLLPTDYYASIEKIFKRKGIVLDDLNDEEHILRQRSITHILHTMADECAAAFPQEAANSKEAWRPVDAEKFHIRSSSTIEDFVDDRFFGTFHTLGRESFFYGYGKHPKPQAIRNLLELVTHFYAMKLSNPDKIREHDKLGIIVMPTVEGNSTIVYSRYPEVSDSRSVVEVASQSFLSYTPLQLIFMDDDGNLNIYAAKMHREEREVKIPSFEEYKGENSNLPDDLAKAYYGDEVKEKKQLAKILRVSIIEEMDEEYPFTIGNTRTSLSKSHLIHLHTRAKWLEKQLGYPVNLEEVFNQDRENYSLQLRPVPHLNEKRKVKNLDSIPEGHTCIAETPFVFGSYRHTARLVSPAYKNDYVQHKFREPVIVIHTESLKGHRFYFSDRRCIAMLDPTMGSALTHHVSLVPGFGPYRDKFAFIGIPGLIDVLAPILIANCVEEPVSKNKKEKGKFYYTPFPVTVESDGRRGRLYVHNEHAHLLKGFSPLSTNEKAFT